VLRNSEGFSTVEVLLWVGVPLALLLIAVVLWPQRRSREQEAQDLRDEQEEELELSSPPGYHGVVPESGGRYPVPPLDLKVPIAPIRRVGVIDDQRARRPAVTSGAARTPNAPGGSDVIL
jgi:NADH-quinone oxidoreductase subunit H